jgi:hypothetical protein
VPTGQPSIQAALDQLGGESGVIEIENSDLYFETPSVVLAAGATIELRAADEQRPVLFLGGDMIVMGGADSSFIMNGLWVAGGDLRIPATPANELRSLILRHCTLSPASTPNPVGGSPPPPDLLPVRLVAEAPNLRVEIEQAIFGVLRVAPEVNVDITDSIVDAGSATAVAYAQVNEEDHGGPLTLRNCTIIGHVRVDVMVLASNTVFYARSIAGEAPVTAGRLQEGCVRYSYVPSSSRVPRKYECQPDRALADLADTLGLESTTDLSDAAVRDVRARVKPVFTSLRFGDPAYGQLSRRTPLEIRQGAEDEAEMGAFHNLYQPQRETNLLTRLDEYLRFGLEAGVFYAS